MEELVLPKRVIDLSKQTFGKLTVVSFAGMRNNGAVWNCRCECGVEKPVSSNVLRMGKARSCGCGQVQSVTVHGLFKAAPGSNKNPAFPCWQAMLGRCLVVTHGSYNNYGAKGIKVCDRWLSFDNFFEDIGPRPSKKHTLDRYPDGYGDYEPGNVRWATAVEQAANRKSTYRIEFGGELKSLSEWSILKGIDACVIYERLEQYGWTIEEALTTPVRAWGQKLRHDGIELTIPQWSERLGIKIETIHYRLKKGWSIQKTLTHSVGGRNRPSDRSA